ncbi:MAG: YggT family protein [Candidatus Promineifilaceae bacterium]|nr:YggT family protein [Candidatus Promineifilaceae bacterium]
MSFLLPIIDLLYWVFWILILVRVVLSFVQVSPYHPLVQMVYQLTEPILEPIRNIMPRTGMIDFSPLIALLLLGLLRRLIYMLII